VAQARLDGKVALVTGASRGIGRGCALALAEDGADVVVNYRSHPDDAAATVREVEGFGRRAFAFGADVSDRSQVDAMVAAAVERFGRIDILVTNAYRSIRQPFLDMTIEGLQQTLAVTMLGVFHTCQAGARAMVARGEGGSIVIVASIHAEHAFAGSAAYNMAKFGITGLGLTMANELTRHRIRVNILNPGWIDTPGERQFLSEEELQAEGKKLPLGRLGQPREMGRVVAFLSSDDASFITGSIIRADGGQIVAMGG
jgi:glucose 1-dehydrogenase